MPFFRSKPKSTPVVISPSDYAREYYTTAKNKCVNLYEWAQSSDERKQRVVACAKTVGEISIVAFAPGSFTSATAGAVLAVMKPEETKRLLSVVDEGIEGSWRDLTFGVKLATVGAVIVAAYLWFPFISYFATVYSAKIGADWSIQNLNKEVKSTQNEKNARKKMF